MVNTGDDTEAASGQVSNSNDGGGEQTTFARPKGEITQNAIKNVLSNKLKIGSARDADDENGTSFHQSYWE